MIEKLLQDVVTALNANTAALNAVANTQGKAPPAGAKADKIAERPAASAKNEQPPAAPSTALTYDKDVKPKVLKLVNTLAKKPGETSGRDRMVAILKEQGVSHAQMLKPEQFAAVVKSVDEALAALGAAK